MNTFSRQRKLFVSQAVIITLSGKILPLRLIYDIINGNVPIWKLLIFLSLSSQLVTKQSQ